MMLPVGSYDCVLSGVYGELNLTSSSSDQELIPLLKQLISMLESGAPFVLTSDLLSGHGGQHLHLHAGGPQAAAVSQAVSSQVATISVQQGWQFYLLIFYLTFICKFCCFLFSKHKFPRQPHPHFNGFSRGAQHLFKDWRLLVISATRQVASVQQASSVSSTNMAATTSADESHVTSKPASTAVINTSLLRQPAQTGMSDRDLLEVHIFIFIKINVFA